MNELTLKQQLFEKLRIVTREFDGLNSDDKDQANRLLFMVEEIVSQFNKGKYDNGPKDLDLNEAELNSLKTKVDDIWEKARRENLEVRPKPDITFRIG